MIDAGNMLAHLLLSRRLLLSEFRRFHVENFSFGVFVDTAVIYILRIYIMRAVERARNAIVSAIYIVRARFVSLEINFGAYGSLQSVSTL